MYNFFLHLVIYKFFVRIYYYSVHILNAKLSRDFINFTATLLFTNLFCNFSNQFNNT